MRGEHEGLLGWGGVGGLGCAQIGDLVRVFFFGFFF